MCLPRQSNAIAAAVGACRRCDVDPAQTAVGLPSGILQCLYLTPSTAAAPKRREHIRKHGNYLDFHICYYSILCIALPA